MTESYSAIGGSLEPFYERPSILCMGALSQWTKKNPTPRRNEVIGHVPVKIYKNS